MSEELMQNARLGVIYLWQGIEVKVPLIESIIGGTLGGIGAGMGAKNWNVPIPDQATDVLTAGVEAKDAVAKGARFKEQIEQWARSFVKKVAEKVKTMLGDIPELAQFIRSIVVFAASQIWQNAAPFIGAANELIDGLAQSGRAFIEKLSTWHAGRRVKIEEGHPKTLLDGIKIGMNRAMWEGLGKIAKSSISIGLNAASCGGAAIVDAVAAVLQSVAKLVWRFAEYCVLNTFINRAKIHWANRETDLSAIHLDAKRFNDWLRPATRKAPVIAALTLGSRIAGDKIRLLQIYNEKGTMISFQQFERGRIYIDKMKGVGAGLINRSGLEFKGQSQAIQDLIDVAKSNRDDIFRRPKAVDGILRGNGRRKAKKRTSRHGGQMAMAA